MGNKIAIALAVILGIMAVVLVNKYIEKKETAFKGEMVLVTVTTQKLGRGNAIKKEDLAPAEVPEKFALRTGAVKWDDSKGYHLRKLAYEVPEGRFLEPYMVDTEEKSAEGIVVQRNKRAYSLSIGGVAGVSGLLVIRDRVDVIGTFLMKEREGAVGAAAEKDIAMARTMYLMRDVEVKALDRTTTGSVQGNYNSVTFELSPEECLLLEFSSSVGQLKLVKRSQEDKFTEYKEDDQKHKVDQTNLKTLIDHAARTRAAERAKE